MQGMARGLGGGGSDDGFGFFLEDQLDLAFLSRSTVTAAAGEPPEEQFVGQAERMAVRDEVRGGRRPLAGRNPGGEHFLWHVAEMRPTFFSWSLLFQLHEEFRPPAG